MRSFFESIKVKIVIFIIIITVGFIFVQSMLTPEASQKESDSVGEVVEDVIETVAPGNETLLDFVNKNIRKIAHFAEFGALGFEAAALVFLWYCYRRRILEKIQISENALPLLFRCLLSFNFGLLVAVFDETIQLIVGRGAEVRDVWIDMFGFSSLFVIGITIMILIRFFVNLIKKHKKGTKL